MKRRRHIPCSIHQVKELVVADERDWVTDAMVEEYTVRHSIQSVEFCFPEKFLAVCSILSVSYWPNEQQFLCPAPQDDFGDQLIEFVSHLERLSRAKAFVRNAKELRKVITFLLYQVDDMR